MFGRGFRSAFGRYINAQRTYCVQKAGPPSWKQSARATYVFARPFLIKSAWIFGATVALSQAVKHSSRADASETAPPADDVPPHAGLDPKRFLKLKVVDVQEMSENTKLYTVETPIPDVDPDLPVTSFVLVQAPFTDKDGKPVMRPYTPVHHEKGHIVLMVKSYPTGTVSKYLSELKPGDEMEVKGPIKKLEYKPNMVKHIGMIAGGTGITPMMQVIRRALIDTDDRTTLSLVFANVSEDDVLMRPMFDSLAKDFPDRFSVHYLLDRPPPGWTYGSGRTSLDVVKKFMPPPGDDSLIMVCGPPPMMAAVSGPKAPDYTQGELAGILKEAGYTKEQVFKF